MGFEIRFDGFQDEDRMLEDFLVSESDDFQALGFEPLGSLEIVGFDFGSVVNGSIEFDHQAFFNAVEVGSVTSHHSLSSELTTGKPPITKQHPKRRFRRSHVLPSLLSQPNQPSSHAKNLIANQSQLSRHQPPKILLPRERGEGVSKADG
jgi:hypothetical protein